MRFALDMPSNMVPHIRSVLEGEYAVPDVKLDGPIVLDIGANVGGFAAWALGEWPGAVVHCYEPHPEALFYLQGNFGKHAGVRIHGQAVRAKCFGRLGYLREGINNLGEASFHDLGAQSGTGWRVPIVWPEELPYADFVKIDCEGCEFEILENYDFDAGPTLAVAVECHFEGAPDHIQRLLPEFDLVGSEPAASGHGVLKFRRRG